MPAGRPRSAGTLPSALDAPFRAEVLCERVLACKCTVRSRDLASTWDSELLAEYVAVRFRGSRGDAELRADLVVRATRCDQRDDLALTSGQAERLILEDWRHASSLPPARRDHHCPKGVFWARYARCGTPPMNADA